MKRREFMSLGGAALSAPAMMARRPSSKRPNILLLIADQLRGDCLGADGNNDIQTPNLDRLASEGGKLVLRPESLLCQSRRFGPNIFLDGIAKIKAQAARLETSGTINGALLSCLCPQWQPMASNGT